mmetsp:Transcript_462/g.1001  ORF Transcript_462/g.1001 Transcript_462/m.1001 type:complete len:209 (+) Transcript_462:1264-1890(+)
MKTLGSFWRATISLRTSKCPSSAASLAMVLPNLSGSVKRSFPPAASPASRKVPTNSTSPLDAATCIGGGYDLVAIFMRAVLPPSIIFFAASALPFKVAQCKAVHPSLSTSSRHFAPFCSINRASTSMFCSALASNMVISSVAVCAVCPLLGAAGASTDGGRASSTSTIPGRLGGAPRRGSRFCTGEVMEVLLSSPMALQINVRRGALP